MARSSLAAALLRAIQPIRRIPQRARLSHKACRWHTQETILPAATDNATPTASDPRGETSPGVTAMKLLTIASNHYQSYCSQRSGLFAVSPSLLSFSISKTARHFHSLSFRAERTPAHCHFERCLPRSLSFRAKGALATVVEKSCRRRVYLDNRRFLHSAATPLRSK